MPEPATIAPRFLSRQEAARYLGVSVDVFDDEVAKGVWPRPFRRGATDRRLTWDRKALDVAADRASGLDGTTLHESEDRPALPTLGATKHGKTTGGRRQSRPSQAA